MSGDQLNLDAIEARAAKVKRYGESDFTPTLIEQDVPALVAEVRRLRESEDRVLSWVETWERESLERGPNDKIHSAGVASLLRLALRRPAARWVAPE